MFTYPVFWCVTSEGIAASNLVALFPTVVGSIMLLRNFGENLPDYTALRPRILSVVIAIRTSNRIKISEPHGVEPFLRNLQCLICSRITSIVLWKLIIPFTDSSQLFPILSQMNPVHTTSFCFFKIRSNIVRVPTSRHC
jgi:hypothetical protein